MNKINFSALIIAFFLVGEVSSQNIQILHNIESGNNRPVITLEHFNTDKYGSNYAFTDFEFNGYKGAINTAFVKINRMLNFWDNPLSINFEYTGGLFYTPEFSSSINNVWVVGGDYQLNSNDYSKILNLKLGYRIEPKIKSESYQFSAIWNLNYFNNKISINGFLHNYIQHNKAIIYAEPQIWYNIDKHLSLGGEVRTGYNFNAPQWKAIPAIGIKYKI